VARDRVVALTAVELVGTDARVQQVVARAGVHHEAPREVRRRKTRVHDVVAASQMELELERRRSERRVPVRLVGERHQHRAGVRVHDVPDLSADEDEPVGRVAEPCRDVRDSSAGMVDDEALVRAGRAVDPDHVGVRRRCVAAGDGAEPEPELCADDTQGRARAGRDRGRHGPCPRVVDARLGPRRRGLDEPEPAQRGERDQEAGAAAPEEQRRCQDNPRRLETAAPSLARGAPVPRRSKV
jgi:hypothetical protein